MDALLERTFAAEQRHFWYRGFKRFVAPLLEQATRGRTRPLLLDAGCGTGANLALLEKYGTPFGVELNGRGLRFGRERGVPRLSQGSVTALPYASASLDVVVSFDVLYCLHPPRGKGGNRRDVPRASPRRVAHRQRRCARNADEVITRFSAERYIDTPERN